MATYASLRRARPRFHTNRPAPAIRNLLLGGFRAEASDTIQPLVFWAAVYCSMVLLLTLPAALTKYDHVHREGRRMRLGNSRRSRCEV